MLVTGVLPRDRVEVVTVDRALGSLGETHTFDDVNEALADGRVLPRAMPRAELSPVTEGIVSAEAKRRAAKQEGSA